MSIITLKTVYRLTIVNSLEENQTMIQHLSISEACQYSFNREKAERHKSHQLLLIMNSNLEDRSELLIKDS